MFIALVFLAHIYVDLIVSATNVLVVFLSTINKHFLLLLLLLLLLESGWKILGERSVAVPLSPLNNLEVLKTPYIQIWCHCGHISSPH